MPEHVTTDDPTSVPDDLADGITDPWVADLDSAFADGECQSTVGFDNHTYSGAPQCYVQLEVREQGVANAHWAGKLCNPCLVGWLEWAAEAPGTIKVVSVNPIVVGS